MTASARPQDSPPTACSNCGTPPPVSGSFGEVRCAGCGQWLIVCSDGACWPDTGMGGQTAGYHERSLHQTPRKRRLRDRRIVESLPLPGGADLHITPMSIIVSRCDEYADGGRTTWYPLHFSVRHGWPRLKIRRVSPWLAERNGEQPIRQIHRRDKKPCP